MSCSRFVVERLGADWAVVDTRPTEPPLLRAGGRPIAVLNVVDEYTAQAIADRYNGIVGMGGSRTCTCRPYHVVGCPAYGEDNRPGEPCQ